MRVSIAKLAVTIAIGESHIDVLHFFVMIYFRLLEKSIVIAWSIRLDEFLFFKPRLTGHDSSLQHIYKMSMPFVKIIWQKSDPQFRRHGFK